MSTEKKKGFSMKKSQNSSEMEEEFKQPNNKKKTTSNKKRGVSIESESPQMNNKIDNSQMNDKSNSSNLTLFSEKLFKFDKENYMKTFILEDESKYHCICNICNEKITAQYAISHVRNEKHKGNTEKVQGKRGLGKLEKLLKSINEAKGNEENKLGSN